MPLKRQSSFEYIFSDLTTCALPSPSSESSPSLSTIPEELYSLILPHLPYPDALSLKHTSRKFYRLVDTSMESKVAWLIDRHTRGLPCPQKQCILKTDAAFCLNSSGEVKRLMEKRRRHEECVPKECEVVVGRKCSIAEGKRKNTATIAMRNRFESSWEDVDPRLIMLAVSVIVFSFLVNVGLGMRIHEKWVGARLHNEWS